LAYSLSGLFAGVAGIVMVSRTNSGQPLAGKGFEFDGVTAMALGGVSVNGGLEKFSTKGPEVDEKVKDVTIKRPTMKDVADYAGVSVSTVSHVLNKTRYVSADASQRIEQAIRTLDSKPNPIAQNLRRGKSKLVGFLVSNMENYFYVNVAKNIEKVLALSGYGLVIVDCAENKKKETDRVGSLMLRGVDGLIIAPTEPNCEYLKKLIDPDFPVVFIDRQPVNYQGDTILLANEEASYMAAKYFISRNYREIGFLTFHYGRNNTDMTIQERINGYKRALEEENIPINDKAIIAIPGSPIGMNELQHTTSYTMMEQLLKIPVRAVLCGNSLAAIGAYSYLRDKKIKIPEEVSIVTFDDDVWLKLTTPAISSVVQPSKSFGVMAAQRLVSRMEGAKMACGCFRLKAEMVLRGS
jgi:DNA-binding LacI/PurR family transcriptional regulator